jgi:conjugal transfer pilin signal peptidase TrbI
MNRLTFLKDRSKWRQGIKACLITLAFLSLVHMNFGILLNNTESLPQKVFLHFKTWPASKGDYTVVRKGFYPLPIIKQIKGEEGDTLHYDKVGELWVNDQKIGSLRPVNSLEEPLTPIKAQTIPHGFVFLFATHPKSFDSRYQEMGLISRRALQGRAIPLW